MASPPDLSEFIGLSNPKKKPCQVCAAAAALTKAEIAQLAAAAVQAKHVITDGAIRDWFARRGHEVSISAITNHRRREGRCDG